MKRRAGCTGHRCQVSMSSSSLSKPGPSADPRPLSNINSLEAERPSPLISNYALKKKSFLFFQETKVHPVHFNSMFQKVNPGKIVGYFHSTTK